MNLVTYVSHYMKRIFITVLLSAFLALSFAPSSSFAAPTIPVQPTTATDAVMFTWGYLDASYQIGQRGVNTSTPDNPTDDSYYIPLFALRAQAQNNIMIALIMRDLSPTAFFYFWGRATAYNEAADLAGEP